MLKKRIRDWRLERNHKLPEMLSALRIAVEKQHRDDDIVTTIRNQHITYAEIKRYFRRRGARDVDAVLLDELDAVTRFENNETQPIVLGPRSNDMASPATTRDMDATPAMALPLTESMKSLELLLQWCHAYCDSALENAQWMMTTQQLRINQLERFYHNFVDGLAWLRAKNTDEAFASFRIAFDLVLPLLKQNHVLFLPYICHVLKGTPYGRYEGEEVVQSLFVLTSRLIEEKYPSLVPIARSFATLSKMSTFDRSESSNFAYQAICTRLETLVPAIESASTIKKIEPDKICDSQHAVETDDYMLALTQTTNAISELAHEARYSPPEIRCQKRLCTDHSANPEEDATSRAFRNEPWRASRHFRRCQPLPPAGTELRTSTPEVRRHLQSHFIATVRWRDKYTEHFRRSR
jgi:hypothetical protein